RRPREPDHGVDAERAGQPRRVLHLLGGALPHAPRLAVSPHPGRPDVAVALIDRVATPRLPLEVVRDGPHLQAVALEQLELALDVAGLVPAPRVEMVAPAGELETVVAPPGCEARHLLERQVGPLAGEERDRTRH